MGHSAKAVANAFLEIAQEHGAVLTPLKIQKLVYIAHGWSLGLLNVPLIDDERAEAWQYGPVFPSLYHEFKCYGKGGISSKATEVDFVDSDDLDLCVVEPKIPESELTTWTLLRRVWDQYGKFGGIGLSELTHRPGTPWERTWKSNRGIKNADIPNDLIAGHYRELRDRNRQKKAEVA
jgi:uncharacterized phage-associated protein